MKKNLAGFNPDTPTNGIRVKEIPSAIREKAKELVKVIEDLEADRVTTNFANIDELIKFSFLLSNSSIGSGLYMKPKDTWIGCSNINSFPTQLPQEDDLRVTVDNQTYTFKNIDGEKIWSLSNNFYPSLYYDLFSFVPKEGKFTFKNIGNYGGENGLFTNSLDFSQNLFMPYLKSAKNSKCRSTIPLNITNKFSFSVLFNNIKREYTKNQETIDPDDIAVLMFVKDKFENVKIGLGYDKSNYLVFINNKKIKDTKIILSEKEYYQLCMKFLNGFVYIYVDDTEVFKEEMPIISNKQLLFSVCEDFDYGNYANASTEFGEINVFELGISPEENLLLKNNPRNWNFKTQHGYLNLTLEEKIRLKEMLKK